MLFLNHVEINGIWGKKRISTSFMNDINIFIGKNGSAKTTFLEIITAALSVNARKLSELSFENVTIILKDNLGRRKKIYIEKKPTEIEYRVSTSAYKIPSLKYDTARDYYYSRLLHLHRKTISEIQRKLESAFILTNISVYRELHNKLDQTDIHQEDGAVSRKSVDDKLIEMTKDLSEFYRNIDKKIQDEELQFQKNMLLAMLYDEKYDTLSNIKNVTSNNIQSLKQGLIAAYQKAGLNDISKKIDQHIARIEKSIEVRKNLKPGDGWNADDAFPLTLYMRTKYIVDALKKLEDKRKVLLESYNKFSNLFASFCGKKMELDAYANRINFCSGDNKINLQQLSSGEKQLFILFVETLLHDNQPVISITDEPELSLHIDWQRKLLQSIRAINANAQIIVATHSPEIAGSYPTHVISMEDILK